MSATRCVKHLKKLMKSVCTKDVINMLTIMFTIPLSKSDFSWVWQIYWGLTLMTSSPTKHGIRLLLCCRYFVINVWSVSTIKMIGLFTFKWKHIHKKSKMIFCKNLGNEFMKNLKPYSTGQVASVPFLHDYRCQFCLKIVVINGQSYMQNTLVHRYVSWVYFTFIRKSVAIKFQNKRIVHRRERILRMQSPNYNQDF